MARKRRWEPESNERMAVADLEVSGLSEFL